MIFRKNGIFSPMLVSFFAASVASQAVAGKSDGKLIAPPADLKIAFTGDTDTTPEGDAVLQLVKKKGAQALLVAGDLNYEKSNAKTWEQHIDSNLGPDFPVIAARGNHDKPWTSKGHYLERLTARWNKLQDKGVLTWSGQPGMASTVKFNGLSFVSVAPSNGVSHEDSAQYILDSAQNDDSMWRVAMWHENMPAFRGNAGCGGGKDLVGWEVFEASREIGAFIINGHNHNYSRSKALSCTGGACSVEKSSKCKTGGELPIVDKSAADPVNSIVMKPGSTFVMLVGMGGHDNGRISNTGPWWAKQGGGGCEAEGAPCTVSNHGATICTFNPGGKDPRKANCEFVDIDGKVIDTYTLTSEIGK
ncbi:MAG: metallophosphoesterase [Oligoflexales bacterium]